MDSQEDKTKSNKEKLDALYQLVEDFNSGKRKFEQPKIPLPPLSWIIARLALVAFLITILKLIIVYKWFGL